MMCMGEHVQGLVNNGLVLFSKEGQIAGLSGYIATYVDNAWSMNFD